MVFESLSKGFFLGLGFMIAIVVVMVGLETSGWQPGKSDSELVNDEEQVSLEKISSKVENIRYFQQRVMVTVSVRNGNSQAAPDTTIRATIYYEDHPIEECSKLFVTIEVEESQTVNLYCTWRWKELDEEKLRAKTKVELYRY